MTSVLIQTTNSLRAETFKLKRTLTPWIVLGGGASAVIFSFLIWYFKLDIESNPDINPWGYYFNLSFAIGSMLMFIPTIVLLAASLAFVEHRAFAWKFLYSLPVSRGALYLSKLLLFVGLLLGIYVSFFLIALMTGALLGVLRPEYGFQSAWPMVGEWLRILLRSFTSVLGLGAFHFVLSIRVQNYLLPLGFGFLGTVVAPVLLGQTDLAYWIPYCYPAFIGQYLDFTDKFVFDAQVWMGLTAVEWFSLAYFIILVALGYLLERWSNVK